MADPRINITIATQGQPQGAAQVTAALNNTAAAAQRAGAAVNPPSGNPWVTASRNLQQLQNQAQQAAPAVDEVGKAATKAAGGNNKAHGMLLLGQAIEDAQYGLRGVMNNIPGLVMSFGLGAGAAGILQIGLVAVSQVLSLLDIQQKKVKDGAIDWSKLTPQEEVEEKLRKVTEQLNEQAEALNKLATARREATTAEKEYAEYLEELNKAKGRDQLPEATMEEYQQRTRARKNELARLPQDQAGLEAQAKAAEVAASFQEKQVKMLADRAGLEQKLAKLTQQRVELEKSESIAGQSFGSSAMRQEEERLQAQLNRLPELKVDGLTGDPEKDREAKAQAFQAQKQQADELRKRANEARSRADAGARELPQAMERIRRQQNLDDIKTEAEVTREAGLEGEKKAEEERAKKAAARVRGDTKVVEPNTEDEYEYVPRPGFIGRGERRLKRPRDKSIEEEAGWQNSDPFENASPPPAAQASGAAAVTEIVSGLDQLATLAQTDQAKQRLAELRALLTDNDGATARDVEMVLQALRQLNANSAESQRAVAGTITAVAQSQQAFAAEMTNLRAQVEQLRNSINSAR